MVVVVICRPPSFPCMRSSGEYRTGSHHFGVCCCEEISWILFYRPGETRVELFILFFFATYTHINYTLQGDV